MQSFEIFTQNRSSFSLSVFVGVMPLKYLLGPVGDVYCLSNTFRMLVPQVTYFHFAYVIGGRPFDSEGGGGGGGGAGTHRVFGQTRPERPL